MYSSTATTAFNNLESIMAVSEHNYYTFHIYTFHHKIASPQNLWRTTLYGPILALRRANPLNMQKISNGTGCTQAVPHPSTILARRCLTSVIKGERVYSSRYGRTQQGMD